MSDDERPTHQWRAGGREGGGSGGGDGLCGGGGGGTGSGASFDAAAAPTAASGGSGEEGGEAATSQATFPEVVRKGITLRGLRSLWQEVQAAFNEGLYFRKDVEVGLCKGGVVPHFSGASEGACFGRYSGFWFW